MIFVQLAAKLICFLEQRADSFSINRIIIERAFLFRKFMAVNTIDMILLFSIPNNNY
jgi:hypothetical protein